MTIDKPAFLDQVAGLEEGPRVVSNIVGVAEGDLRCDMTLVAVYDDVSDDTTLIRFTAGSS